VCMLGCFSPLQGCLLLVCGCGLGCVWVGFEVGGWCGFFFFLVYVVGVLVVFVYLSCVGGGQSLVSWQLSLVCCCGAAVQAYSVGSSGCFRFLLFRSSWFVWVVVLLVGVLVVVFACLRVMLRREVPLRGV